MDPYLSDPYPSHACGWFDPLCLTCFRGLYSCLSEHLDRAAAAARAARSPSVYRNLLAAGHQALQTRPTGPGRPMSAAHRRALLACVRSLGDPLFDGPQRWEPADGDEVLRLAASMAALMVNDEAIARESLRSAERSVGPEPLSEDLGPEARADLQRQLSHRVEDDGDCTICLEPLHSPVITAPCGHVFGGSCIARWIGDHSTCAMCRRELHISQLVRLAATSDVARDGGNIDSAL